jgi:hypothetical protein
MDAAADRDPADGTLVLRGSVEGSISAEIRRGSPLTLGDEKMLPTPAAQAPLTQAVSDLVSMPQAGTTADLAGQGVRYIYVPEPVDPDLASALDAVPDLVSASADDPVARAWELEGATSLPTVDTGASARLRPALLGLQALALLVVLVLAAPTRRRRP